MTRKGEARANKRHATLNLHSFREREEKRFQEMKKCKKFQFVYPGQEIVDEIVDEILEKERQQYLDTFLVFSLQSQAFTASLQDSQLLSGSKRENHVSKLNMV